VRLELHPEARAELRSAALCYDEPHVEVAGTGYAGLLASR
jgi:hypothetical protein